MSDAGAGPARLESVRQRIEAIDRGIVAALAERVRLAHEAATAKRAAGQPTLDPPREAAVVRRAADEARALGLPDEPVREIFWQVIALCRSEQLDRA
jgi:chorismate mutase / prephenate dehydrogenase